MTCLGGNASRFRTALGLALAVGFACASSACGSAPADRPVPPPAGFPAEASEDEAELARGERLLGLAPPITEAPEASTPGMPGPSAARPTVGAEPLGTEPPACETACTALASMVRAADRICGLSGPGDRCNRAQSRVDRARTHVESTCGSCS